MTSYYSVTATELLLLHVGYYRPNCIASAAVIAAVVAQTPSARVNLVFVNARRQISMPQKTFISYSLQCLQGFVARLCGQWRDDVEVFGLQHNI